MKKISVNSEVGATGERQLLIDEAEGFEALPVDVILLAPEEL